MFCFCSVSVCHDFQGAECGGVLMGREDVTDLPGEVVWL